MPAKRRKISLRLKDYDYSASNAYFITLHLHDCNIDMGKIENNSVDLNETGKLMEKWWLEIPKKFKTVIHDQYKIMPTHLHGIIMLFNDPFWNLNASSVGADLCVRPNIKQIIQWFKTISTNDYIKGVKENRLKPFNKKIWQRSFYDRIIRNEKEFELIQEYIFFNPIKWIWDKEEFERLLKDIDKPKNG